MVSRAFYFLLAGLLVPGCDSHPEKQPVLSQAVRIDGTMIRQTIDGFGVNINPAQWRDGNLKSAIDLLVNDLGATLFRFDCVGFADWLDPAMRNDDGTYPQDYLVEVYTNKTFQDAWATFRYLNDKGIVPFFNVSGKIPPGLSDPDHPRFLKDLDGYVEMIATMLRWARQEEELTVRLLDPYNETDLGYRYWMPAEGPGLETSQLLALTHKLVDRLDAYGLSDVSLMVMSDSDPSIDRISPFLLDSTLRTRITHFGFHIYGGYEGVPRALSDTIDHSIYQGAHKWMTEYGDLDLTTLVEQRVSMRSTNMLIDFINDGFTGGLVWDAFDNYHNHDEAWSEFGLLKTDTLNWTYAKKRRFYAAKQVYRFVPSGFQRIGIPHHPDTTVANWSLKDPFRHIKIMAFVSPAKDDITVVFTSAIEGDVDMKVELARFGDALENKTLYVYRTSDKLNCAKTDEIPVDGNAVHVILRPDEILTLSTIR